MLELNQFARMRLQTRIVKVWR